MKRVHVYISGRVQGVWFRASTKRIADEYGLSGWVKNLPDGRVEAVFEGDEEAVKKAVKWCHQGPPGAVVEKVEVIEEIPEGLSGFFIKY